VNENPKMYLINSFSLNMLDDLDKPTTVYIYPKTAEWVRERLPRSGFVSAVGHTSTARVLSNVLGFEVPTNRITVKLKRFDTAIVAQYIGPRLPEGATRLPEGAKVKFFLVQV
jgi:hypothetical protein